MDNSICLLTWIKDKRRREPEQQDAVWLLKRAHMNQIVRYYNQLESKSRRSNTMKETGT